MPEYEEKLAAFIIPEIELRDVQISIGDLDLFVAKSDEIGPPSSSLVHEFWEGITFIPEQLIDQTLDPFSDEYTAQQIGLYCEISGRDINQEVNELLQFDITSHLESANPYAHHSPASVGLHLARIARAIQYSNLKMNAHVLDMGCGWGTSSEIMAFAGLTVTGLDINPRFVELVNSRSKRIGHNVDAVQGRFDLIPGEALYDAALFYEFLHHAIRPWEVLDLVRSRLKIGGKLLLAGEPINNIWKHWGIRTDPLSLYCIRKYGWFESGWSADFLKECVERSQFKIEHFAEEPNGIGWTLVAQAAS